MGEAKIVGRIRRWIKEHGLPKERGVCKDCAWFSWDYPKFVCLKWDIDTRPDEVCKKGGFLRRSSIEDKKVVLIGYWDEEFNTDIWRITATCWTYGSIRANYLLR